MRDGLSLPADVYLPPSQESHFSKKYPCILLRSTAGRKAEPWVHYAALSQLGYVVVIQDTRSAVDLEGKTPPFLSDGWGKLQDGYDTIEWLAKSDYSNGDIGTLGFSALGITQLMLAPCAPPSLKCQYIGVAPASLYHHAIFPGGQLRKNQVEGWLGLYAKDTGVVSYVANQPFYNEFWKALDTTIVADRVKSPALFYGGWYDTFLEGTIQAFLSRHQSGAEGAKGKQKLLIGPWTHFWPYVTKLGDFEVPKEGANPPFDTSPQRWFDHYLKGNKNGVDELPSIIYYVMGPFDGTPSKGNVWKSAEQWPIPAKHTPLYLTQDRELVFGTFSETPSSLTYRYDPRDPVPTIGGSNLFLESGPKDQRLLEERSDVLTFTSKPLEEDLEVTGKIVAKILFSSEQSDTDIVVRLTDVYPDGRSILILDGIHRTGINTKHSANKQQEVDVDLWSTSLVFAKGHRIRVSVSSSNYPRAENNLNVGVYGANTGAFKIVQNTLHFGGERGSHLILPIVSDSLN